MKLFALLGLLAIPAVAFAGGGERGKSGDEGASAPRERLICRTEDVTRTRVRRNRVCLTQAEWDERRNNARDGGERIQTQQTERGN